MKEIVRKIGVLCIVALALVFFGCAKEKKHKPAQRQAAVIAPIVGTLEFFSTSDGNFLLRIPTTAVPQGLVAQPIGQITEIGWSSNRQGLLASSLLKTDYNIEFGQTILAGIEPTTMGGDGYIEGIPFIGTDATETIVFDPNKWQISPMAEVIDDGAGGKFLRIYIKNITLAPADIVGDGGFSVEISAPVNLTATPGDGSVLLTWSPENNISGYNVYVGTQAEIYGAPINVGNIIENGLVSFEVTGLTNGQIYFFAVTAYNALGQESAFSVERSATPQVLAGDLIPPQTPTNFIALPGNGMVELIWDPVPDADLFVYEVFSGNTPGVYGAPINAGNIVASDGRIHYVVAGLINGSIYYFTVRAVDTSGNRSGNAIEQGVIPQVLVGDLTPPAAPGNFVAIPGDGLVDLQWSANIEPDLFGYQVRVKIAGGSYGIPINVGNVTSYQVTGLTNGTQYSFAITALDTSGNESGLSVELSAIPTAGLSGDTTPPAIPIGLWLISGNGEAQGGWTANTETDLSGYYVYWGTTSGNYSNFLNVGNRTTWRFNGLAINQTYYFSLGAYDTSGNLSSYAAEVSATITANATLTFTEQPDERIIFSTLTADIAPRLINGPANPANITQICWNSDVVGWYPNSNRCLNFDQTAINTTITDIPTDQSHRLKGNFSVVVNGQAVYFDLVMWQTSPLGGIWSDGQGGLEVNMTFQDLPPAVPQNIVVASGNSEATISWQANAENDLAGYRVHYGTVSGTYGFHLNVGNTGGYILQSLNNGTVYFIALTAYDQAGNESGYSTEVSVTPSMTSGPDTTPPLVPQNLVASSGDTSVNLYWSANLDSDLASYNVYWGTQSGGYANVISGVTNTNQSVTGLTNGTRYYFAVSAADTSANESGISVEASSVPNGQVIDLIPPNPPVNLVATAGDGAISLTWSDNIEPDLGGYRVHVGTVSRNYTTIIDVGNQTNYLLQGLANGTLYYAAITAYDNSPNRNESGFSLEVSARPQADLPPALPSGLVAVAGDGYIDFSWNNNAESDLAGYILYYGTASRAYTSAVVVGNVTVARINNLANGTLYYAAITAYDLADNESGYSAEVNAIPAVPPDVTPPLRPQNLSALPGSSLVDLYWSANLESDLASYTVYWGTASGNYPNVIQNVTQPSRRISGLTDGIRYYFAVSAVDLSGNESEKSIERSAVPNGTIPDTTPPAPPVNLVAQAGNQTINLTWSPNVEADLGHYNIRYGIVSGVYGAPINTGTTNNYQLNSLTNGVTYYLVATAVDTSNNESNYSQEVTAIPTVTGGDTTPPNLPAGVVATAGDGFVDLNWTANSEPDLWGYNLYYGTSSGSYTTTLNLGNRISYRVAGLSNGTTYYFALTAYDTSSNESGYSSEVNAMPVVGGGGSVPGAPATPTGLTATVTASETIRLDWNPNSEADLAGYKISYGTTPGVYTDFLYVGSDRTFQNFGGMSTGTTYYFKLEAYDTDGNYSIPAGPVSAIP